MAAPEDIRKIHASVEAIKRLSDRVVGVGPFGVGLDGILAWIPGAGGVYGVGAGAFLIVQAMRAKAAPFTLLRMLGYLAFDTATGAVPIVGDAVDFFFPGHLMAAKALQKDIEKRHGPMAAPKSRSGKPRKVGESSAAGTTVGRRR